MKTRKYKGWKINCNTRRGYPCGSVIELTKVKAIESAQEVMPWLTKKYIALMAYRIENMENQEFDVAVRKSMSCRGIVKTRASSYDEAVSLVNQKICKGDLQTASV